MRVDVCERQSEKVVLHVSSCHRCVLGKNNLAKCGSANTPTDIWEPKWSLYREFMYRLAQRRQSRAYGLTSPHWRRRIILINHVVHVSVMFTCSLLDYYIRLDVRCRSRICLSESAEWVQLRELLLHSSLRSCCYFHALIGACFFFFCSPIHRH